MGFRRGVTVGTFRNQSMFSVTQGAANATMLAAGIAPLAINIVMAGVAGLKINLFVQVDIEWLVNIVALGAGCHCLGSKVWLMTFCTGWDVAMLVVVTTAAFLLSVFARLLLQFSCLAAVTVRTDASQHVTHRNLARSVRIAVTIQAVNMFLTVWRGMAGGTFRHNFRVVLF